MHSGAFGQDNVLGNVIFPSLLVVLLAGCGAGGGGRYVGDLTTTQGNCGLGIDPQGKATATLMVRGDNVQFAPTDGVVVLPGHVNGAGHVLAGSNATGADKKPFPQVFEGDRDGERVRGTFATPLCRASVELRRD